MLEHYIIDEWLSLIVNFIVNVYMLLNVYHYKPEKTCFSSRIFSDGLMDYFQSK